MTPQVTTEDVENLLGADDGAVLILRGTEIALATDEGDDLTGGDVDGDVAQHLRLAVEGRQGVDREQPLSHARLPSLRGMP